jgi:hypothetical protein
MWRSVMKSSNTRALVGAGLLTGSFRAMLSSALTMAALTTITSVVAMSSARQSPKSLISRLSTPTLLTERRRTSIVMA